jgi:predicted extracellular nuclease
VFTVMTWNVENLFRAGTEFGPKDPEVYAGKLARLAHTINITNPDVVGLQEIGELAALDDLVERLNGDWSVIVAKKADQRGIRVGFITRWPVIETDDIAEFPSGFAAVPSNDTGGVTAAMGRGALRMRSATAGAATVDLVVCHLKSKLVTYPNERFSPLDEGERARFGAYALYRRAAEAVTVRTYLNELIGGDGAAQPTILLGDMNDEPQAATTQILLGPAGSEIGTPGERIPDKGDAWRLWNLAPLMPDEARYSRIYRGREELIDHIFVSRALLERVTSVRALVDRPLPSITDDPNLRRDARDSDHAPIVAAFDL